MLVEFRCGNYTRFDQKTGQYVVCGQRMTADSSDVGLVVTCPRCQKDVEVPVPNKNRSDEKGRAKPKNKPAAAEDELVLEPEMEVPGKKPRKANKAPRPADSPALATEARRTSKRQRCPRCGTHLDDRGVCTACRYVKPRFEKAKMSLDEMKMEPAGMMLWFSQVMSEGIPMKTLAMLAHVLIPLLAAAICLLAVFAVGGIFGGLLFLLVFLALMFYAALAYKGYRFLSSGNTQLAWFQKPFWNFILAWCRFRKWQGVDQRHRDRNIIDKRGEPITDEAFATLKGLKNSQILDLEGTLLTDQSLELMYRMKYLQCVVLKNTKVTHQGVTRLQQSVPRLWIWY